MTEKRKKELEKRKGESDVLEEARIEKLREKQKKGKDIWTEENLKPVFVEKKTDNIQAKKRKDLNDNTNIPASKNANTPAFKNANTPASKNTNTPASKNIKKMKLS